MAAKILNLVAISSLAILACSFGATPANALSVDTTPNFARHFPHHGAALKKRATSRRCKPRSSSLAASSTKVSAAPSSTKAADPIATPKADPKPTSTKPKPTPTPQPAPPTNNGGGGGKAGLAWANGDDSSLKNFVSPKVRFIYSWSPWKPAGSDALGLEFTPMLWGSKQVAQFKQLVKAGYAKTALGMNEPDHSGQANMSPDDAVTLWRNNMEPLVSQGYQLVSPAVTSGSGGKPWLQSFINKCSGCHIDAIALHWYGTDPQALISYVQGFHTTFGKDIWITEFACQNFSGGPQCSQSDVVNFMNVVTAFFDNTSYVKRYFWFGAMHNMVGVNPDNQLMNSDGTPNSLGRNYMS
jgi:hypothetical protein